MKYLLFLLSFMSLVVGHPTEKVKSIINEDYSLSNLLGMSQIPSAWLAGDSSVLEEGRVVLTPTKTSKGSLWAKTLYKLQDSFTMEWTFRSTHYLGPSKGGISFWFISDAIPENDKKLYNGPSKFDGLQMLVDNNSNFKSSFSLQLNDGSESYDSSNVHSKTIGKCLLSYQDQSVPSTVRLSYSSNEHLLKIQINNKICLQTKKIKLPKGNYFVGVSADNDNNEESFEILQMKMYDTLTEQSLIPNVIQMPQPQLLTKIVDKSTGKEKIVSKEEFDSKSKKVTSGEIYQKLDKIEGKILANDIHSLDDLLNDLLKAQDGLTKQLAQLVEIVGARSIKDTPNANGNKIDTEKYQDFLSLNEKLDKMITDQQRVRESTSHMNNSSHIESIVNKLALFFIPFLFVMCIMTYHTIKIKQELLKTKLL